MLSERFSFQSEFFSNFQTAISLLHDPKGLDIIGEILANPELIENYVGGKSGGPDVALSGGKTAVKATDGDIGVDFSNVEDGKPINVNKENMPVVSANLDYYSSVDHAKPEKEEPIPDHVDVEETIPAVNSTIPLPEISESIDAAPQEYEVIEETISIPKGVEMPVKTTTAVTLTTTSTLPPYTTTKRNFRIRDPYYAIYYDV
jgi:hypothetical protein